MGSYTSSSACIKEHERYISMVARDQAIQVLGTMHAHVKTKCWEKPNTQDHYHLDEFGLSKIPMHRHDLT